MKNRFKTIHMLAIILAMGTVGAFTASTSFAARAASEIDSVDASDVAAPHVVKCEVTDIDETSPGNARYTLKCADGQVREVVLPKGSLKDGDIKFVEV